MKKLALLLIVLVFTAFKVENLQEKMVKGRVYSLVDGNALPGVKVKVKGTDRSTKTNLYGKYEILVPSGSSFLSFSKSGFETQEVEIRRRTEINVGLVHVEFEEEDEISEILSMPPVREKRDATRAKSSAYMTMDMNGGSAPVSYHQEPGYQDFNTEEYDLINENIFLASRVNPLSTFSIDVDAASYSNLRRMLNYGQIPPKDAIRIEELINYFDYEYEDPRGEHPFSIITEVSQAPWSPKHKLVHIGLQGKKVDYDQLDPCNLVFLVDVSGSMSAANKLPLLKSSLKLLVGELGARDRVAIVAYAGAAGLVLPSTPATEKDKIINALDRLQSGGSTAGGQGIKLAYKVAKDNLVESGNNRVILATDGDFNVGTSSTSELVRMIEEKRSEGIFLTITGFGMGNYKDGRMEQISNAGNGNYFYIDNLKEAQKVFVTEMRATLFTIAKDVKIQVEFNPVTVQAYRLIGYENRKLKSEDFNDDKKDAGELGAGHTVTALYEIIPAGVKSEFIKDVDDLKYQDNSISRSSGSEDLMTVKFRYKKPDQDKSRLITQIIKNTSDQWEGTSNNFRFSAAVAAYGMLMRESEFKGSSTYDDVISWALGAKGNDQRGYRIEFINMVRSSKLLARG